MKNLILVGTIIMLVAQVMHTFTIFMGLAHCAQSHWIPWSCLSPCLKVRVTQ